MTDAKKTSRRSQAWFGAEGRSGMVYRSWMRNQGFGHEVFDGRPVIGIATSASELAPCNAHLTRVAEAVKRGVWQAGGFPLQFPTMATGETLMRPTAMLYRNLMTMEVEELLVSEGLWSQYLEVGIGPDPEVFTKAPVLSAVGTGADIGVLTDSVWNNPEPEAVLVVDSRGRVRGATLGNDVNLRDIEGRSALLLSRAKDNNASCAVGPFVRLLDDGFDLDTVRGLDIDLRVDGADGYVLQGSSSMREISRDVLDLVAATHGAHHQYPDGFVLFTGTLFAPTEDRHAPGPGFTHEYGDVVRISSPPLGALVNTVVPSEQAAPWSFGVRALMHNLARRGML
jgi:fumarylacetoacetate (FAA) hydrolase family protein